MDHSTNHEPPSLGAVALDTGAYAKTVAALPAARRAADDEPAEEDPDRRVPLHLKVVFGVILAGCVGILGVAAVRTAASMRADARSSRASVDVARVQAGASPNAVASPVVAPPLPAPTGGAPAVVTATAPAANASAPVVAAAAPAKPASAAPADGKAHRSKGGKAAPAKKHGKKKRS